MNRLPAVFETRAEGRGEQRAKANDCNVKSYVKKLIEKDVHRKQTFDEILAPFRQAVEKAAFPMMS